MFRFDMRRRYGATDTQPAADLVRYLQREGEFAPKQGKHVTERIRTSKDTAYHADLVGQPIVRHLPYWAQDNAGFFFKTASEYETRGPYAIAFQISLPRILSHAQQGALAEDIADALMADKPYLLVKHEPITRGEANPHIHILMGLRNEDGIAREEAQYFRRWNREEPERGGAQKDRFWNQRQTPRVVRQGITDLANFYLELTGTDERIDPRSLRKQGIERERLGWNNRGTLDPTTLAQEQRQAAAAWEQRKAYKEIDNIITIPREDYVYLVRQWTRNAPAGTALPTSSSDAVTAYHERERARLAQEAQALRQDIRTLETYVATVQRSRPRIAIGRGYDINLRIEDEYERDPQGRSLSR